MHRRKVVLFALPVLSGAMLLMACQTIPKAPSLPVFFPAPPDPPRVQYLRFFTSRKEVVTKYSWIDRLVGPSETGLIGFVKPYGVAVMRDKFYVCDTIAGTVWAVDFVQGKFEMLAGDRRQGKLKKPINLTIDSDGKKYVADVDRGQIVVYGADDQYLTAFGSGENLKPTDVAIAGDKLVITDLNRHELQIRDKQTGKLLREIGSPETGPMEETLGQPTNLAIDHQGNLLVSDAGRFRIMIFSMEGAYLGHIGEIGKQMGQFARPKGIAVDRAGRIYVVDTAFENIQMFDEQHRLLMWFGGHGSDEGALVLPAGIAVDYDNLDYFRKFVAPGYDLECVLWVVSQDGPRRVSCYGLLKSPSVTTAAAK